MTFAHPLLPVWIAAIALAASRPDGAPGDEPPARAAEDATRAQPPRAIEWTSLALDGSGRTLVLRGLRPSGGAAPWVLVAAASGEEPERLATWLAPLARSGYVALALERGKDEPADRYSDALLAALKQATAEASTAGRPLHGVLAPRAPLLVADGEAAAAAARAAARASELRGLALIDPPEPGAALSWLPAIQAPLVTIASGVPAHPRAQAWFRAARNSRSERCCVRLLGEASFASSSETPALARDLGDLVVAFAEAQIPRPDRGAQPFAARARQGAVDRVVETTTGAVVAARR